MRKHFDAALAAPALALTVRQLLKDKTTREYSLYVRIGGYLFLCFFVIEMAVNVNCKNEKL
jgi:hypothetical protein